MRIYRNKASVWKRNDIWSEDDSESMTEEKKNLKGIEVSEKEAEH